MGSVDAAMAELGHQDTDTSLTQELLGEAWMSVATQYILRRSQLKQKVKQKETLRKKRRGGWHPKPRQYLFWGRDIKTCSRAELWEHDHQAVALA